MVRILAGLLLSFLLSFAWIAGGLVGEASSFPQRIISSSPSITEFLFALDAGERVVGVTRFCRFPPEAVHKPRIGGFYNTNLEAVVGLRPDLVVIHQERVELERRLEALDIPTLVVNPSDLKGIYSTIDLLAERLGIVARGRQLKSRMTQELSRLRQKFQVLSNERPKTVLVVIGRTPGTLSGLVGVGGTSYLNELIHLAGGKNILTDQALSYPRISLEEVIRRDPDLILDMSHGDAAESPAARAIRKRWKDLKSLRAVRSDSIHIVDSSPFVVPGPRLTEAVARLAALIAEVP